MRATVHSLLAQAEYLGEIIVGFALALVARSTSVPAALTGAAVVMVATTVIVLRHGPETKSIPSTV